jgi:hypothetical protein
MVLTGFIFYAILIAIVGLYVATGMWLDNHGGARRWHVWLMTVVASAAVGVDILLTVGPRFIAFGAGFGAIVGGIVGLFVKVPQPIRRRRREPRPRPRV